MTNFDTGSLPDCGSSDDGTSQSKEIIKMDPYLFTTSPHPDTPIESIEDDGTSNLESDGCSNHESTPKYGRSKWSTPPQIKAQRVRFDVPADETRHLKRKRAYNTTPLPRLNPATGYTAPVLFRGQDGSITSDEDEDEIQPAAKRPRNEIATPVTYFTSNRGFESSFCRDERENSAAANTGDLDPVEGLKDEVPLASGFDDSDAFVREWILSIPTVYPSWDDEVTADDFQQRDRTLDYDSDIESMISNKAPKSLSYGPRSPTFALNSPSYVPSAPAQIKREGELAYMEWREGSWSLARSAGSVAYVEVPAREEHLNKEY
ncbi:hypothetical protein QBC40DRAFT_292024 [Triangularia verruculosa]|uniref:Uncharacterized protein n=1 Tax=Triangularia verruculosa TaxID=2587418 RepID=A0AAN6XV84_9PEZI|nr:hypothetical protein QBC40DRAFT_292024 [Triangularia verruculosa]